MLEAIPAPPASALPSTLYADPEPTRSEFERAFLDLVRAASLPLPSVNARINGHEVDFVWRAERLAVELDSWKFHGTRAAFERDRPPR